LRCFFPVAEQQIGTAARTQIAGKDIFTGNASFQELQSIGFGQVQEDFFGRRLVTRRHPVQPLQRVRLVPGAQLIEEFGGVRKLRLEGRSHFRADLVATPADRRTDGSEQIFWLRSKLHLHPANRFGDDASQRSAPTRMHRRDCAIPGIRQENGHAVRGLHRQQQAGTVGDGGVCARRLRRGLIETQDGVRVKLQQRNENELVRADCRLKAVTIFAHILAGVPFREAQI